MKNSNWYLAFDQHAKFYIIGSKIKLIFCFPLLKQLKVSYPKNIKKIGLSIIMLLLRDMYLLHLLNISAYKNLFLWLLPAFFCIYPLFSLSHLEYFIIHNSFLLSYFYAYFNFKHHYNIYISQYKPVQLAHILSYLIIVLLL